MSRLGKLPIIIPPGVTVTVAQTLVTIKGPKGELKENLPRQVQIDATSERVVVKLKHPDHNEDRSFWGLARQLIANAVIGVSEGFKKQLEINGVGFRAATEGKNLVLNVGFSHPVNFPLPDGITAKVEKNVITIEGASKQQVGEIAAQVRNVRPPEPYKGKGIKYMNEIIIRKAGKLAKAAAGPAK
ncbi:TPA: 50S ribosomal protein L6 [Patescibacteria group bacterium]|nr:MAG: 50S ribosomal protein L6 [Parcubacteria group bacterium GW2011_GWA2_46_39]HBV33557.1 50S ribosomal protein L6 [Patescibacteria group bacterium]HCU47810.1 50S ribosomal protein L6 [Patescibacteria group bacterium]